MYFLSVSTAPRKTVKFILTWMLFGSGSQVNLCREDKGKRKTGCLNPVAGAAGEGEKREERGEERS